MSKRISEQTRSLFVNLYNNGFTINEIAKETKYSPASVNKIKREAIRQESKK